MSLFGVIECPQLPSVRRVAALALLAEAALVHVIVRVALVALPRRLVERERRVALRAADHAMQCQQRKVREVMIEHDVGPPGLLAMASFAAILELAGMRVFALVAAGAVLGQLLSGDGGGMAGVAIDLVMRPTSGNLCLPV